MLKMFGKNFLSKTRSIAYKERCSAWVPWNQMMVSSIADHAVFNCVSQYTFMCVWLFRIVPVKLCDKCANSSLWGALLVIVAHVVVFPFIILSVLGRNWRPMIIWICWRQAASVTVLIHILIRGIKSIHCYCLFIFQLVKVI
jgi:hypothetical protein